MSKVIPVGDYVQRIDTVETLKLSDGYSVILRVRRPMPDDEIKIMEFVQLGVSEGMFDAEGNQPEFDHLDATDRMRVVRWSYDYNGMLISSCCFHPTMDSEGNIADVQEENPKKVWDTKDDVIKKCPVKLYHAIKKFIAEEGVAEVVSAGEAGK